MLTVGSFALSVTGEGYVPGSAVTFDGAQVPTSYVSPTSLTATGSTPAPALSVPVFVTTPDGDTSNTAYVSVVAASPITVSVSPASVSLRVKTTRQFTATVEGAPNPSVTWSVNGVTGGSNSVGTISRAGLYKAPNAVPNPSTVTIGARLVVDPTKSATASVTVTRK